MHPATILVFACACAVYAQELPLRSHSHIFGPPGGLTVLQKAKPSPVSYWIDNPRVNYQKTPSQNPDYEPINQDLPNNSPEWPSKPTNTWVIDHSSSSSEEEYRPRLPEDDDSGILKSLQDLPQAWTPPPYHQSLKDYEEAVANMKSHFTPNAFTDKNNKNFRYIIIVHVVDYLSKTVAEQGWESYEKNYSRKIREYVERAVKDPLGVVNQLMCVVLDPANRKLQKLKKIVHSPVVEFLCKTHPATCDTVIYALIKLSHDIEIHHAANLLLALGKAASTFLKSYASAFDAISTQNVYLYLSNSADHLRELVGKNAEVRKLLYPNGSRPCLQ